ncbi:MAG: hypothetical protein HRT74_04350, partial [Flavobacteriales bacterium]|nr:hypothetical protein [Flavobacteriales bacterium]
PYSFSDTTITYLLETRDAYYYDFRVGMEFFKPNRTTTMVYGFDAVIGWSRDYESDQTQPFYIDPICDCTVPSPFVASQTSNSGS